MLRINKLVLLISLLCACKAFADSGNPLLRSNEINPADITWELEGQAPVEKHKPMPKLQVENLEAPLNTAPVTNEPTFQLKGIELIHQNPIPSQVTEVYQPYLNKPVSFSTLKVIAAQMQAKYQELGVLLVQVVVPPQEIDKDQGVVKLQVIEGQVQEVVFTGDDPKGAKTQLERYAAGIEHEDPINYQTMDHFLALANSLPGIDVSATVVPSKIPGAADLVINVKRTPRFTYASFNNYASSYIGPGQVLAGTTLYDIYGADSLSVTAANSTPTQHGLRFINAGYDIVTGPYSTEINPTISKTVTRPGASLAAFDMLGVSTKAALNVTQPVIVNTRQNFSLTGSMYRLSSSNSAYTNQLLYDDEITALTAGLDYKGVAFNSYNTMDAYTTVGLPILGAPSTLTSPSRANGKTQFIIFDFDTSTIHYFTHSLNVAFNTTGQITPNPLLSSEQLGYGGMQFGQGLSPYIISGDNGIMGSIALRYDVPMNNYFNQLQPQIFYNAGAVSNNANLVGNYGHAWGSSAGVGANISMYHAIQMSVILAKPLNLTQGIAGKDWQGFINATAIF